jgi:hypothetical protein
MRPLIGALAVLVACNGDGNKDNTDDTDTGGTSGPPSFEFRTDVPAKEYVAEIDPAAIQAHQAVSMLTAATGVVVADEKVQDRLNTNGGGSLLRQYLECWSRPEFPMFSFAIDYSNCGAYQMGGGVFVNDHPSGPLLFEFSNFAIQERQIGGVLALDTRDAFPSPLYWQAYDTDADSPGPDNRVQMGVQLDGQLKGLSLDGGASVDFLNQQWAMWGVATLSGDPPLTVVLGGTDPADVAPDDPPGADSLKASLNWLECRCPTEGVSAYDMPLLLTQVVLDIDDLESEPDDVDDPDLEIPVAVEVQGRSVLEHTGCGEYDVSYSSEAATIPIPKDQIIGRISFACDTLTIDDPERCQALIRAAVAIEGETLDVQITQEDLDATAREAVDRDFDTTWCRIY